MAGAQTANQAVLPLSQYPPGSIRSVEQAEQALSEVKSAQSLQEKGYAERRRACYGKLVAESCLMQATEDNARAERRIRAVLVEARTFKRAAAEREARAARTAKAEHEAAQAPVRQSERARTSALHLQHGERNAQAAREFEARAGERALRAAAEQRRDNEKRAARARKEKDDRAGQAARAERVRAHEKKVNEVLARAREKEARAAEKPQQAGAVANVSAGTGASVPAAVRDQSNAGAASGKPQAGPVK